MLTEDHTFLRSYESLFWGEVKRLKQVERAAQNAIHGRPKKSTQSKCALRHMYTHLCIYSYIALVSRPFKMAHRTVLFCNASIGR